MYFFFWLFFRFFQAKEKLVFTVYPYLPPGDPRKEPAGGEVQEVPVDAALGRGPQGAQGQLPPRPALRPGGAAGGRG